MDEVSACRLEEGMGPESALLTRSDGAVSVWAAGAEKEEEGLGDAAEEEGACCSEEAASDVSSDVLATDC